MKIKILLAGLMPFILTSVQAETGGSFFSKININAQISDEGGNSFSEIRSNNSWLGVKGSYDLSDDLEAIYHLEWKVDITGEKGQDILTERPQFVGLKGAFGQVTIGRQFTVTWDPGRVDLFNHYEGDIKVLFKGESRLTDTVAYTSPTYNGFKFAGLYQAEKTEDGQAAVSAGVFYGDRKLKSGNMFFALTQDFDVKEYDVTRAVARFKLNNSKIGLIVQNQQLSEGGDSDTGVMVNIEHKIQQYSLKAQYQVLEDDSFWNLGVDYALAKNTKLYSWIANGHFENKEDTQYLAVGIEHKITLKF